MRYCGSLPGNTHSSPPSPSSPIVSLFSTLLYARMCVCVCVCVRILCGVPTVPFVPAPLFMTLFLQGWLLRALVFGKLPLAFTNQFHSIRQRNTIVMFDKNYSLQNYAFHQECMQKVLLLFPQKTYSWLFPNNFLRQSQNI